MPTLRKPEERTCERCGRSEVWDDDEHTWRIASDDGEDGDPLVGDPHCIHEWDINGTFAPFES